MIIGKTTQREIRELIKYGYAKDISNIIDRDDLLESVTSIGYAKGSGGIIGAIYIGNETKKLYAIPSKCLALYIFS